MQNKELRAISSAWNYVIFAHNRIKYLSLQAIEKEYDYKTKKSYEDR